MTLIKLYESLLRVANMVVSEDGYVSSLVADDRIPVVIEGRRLVLPTKEHLSNGEWDKRIVFHPLSENIYNNESLVLERFRKLLTMRISDTIVFLSCFLLKKAISQAEHKNLSPDQSEYLSVVADADEKMYTNFKKLLGKIDRSDIDRSLFSIFLRKSALLDGKKRKRVGVISFPLYTALKEAKDNVVWGVALRIKDRSTILALFEYLLPGIDKPGSYNRASDSDVAPFVDALMQSVYAVTGPLNDTLELFKNQIHNYDYFVFDSAWVEPFNNLDALMPLIRDIPMQAGNEGQPSNPSAPIPVAPVAAAPAQTTFSSAYVAPFQQRALTPPPGPVDTGNGLDFNSIIRSNPAIQAQLQIPQNGGYPIANQQRREPVWANSGSQFSNSNNQPQQSYPNAGGSSLASAFRR